MPTKCCSKCNNILPIESFPRRLDSADGHRGICKKCYNYRMNTYYSNNKARCALKQEKYRKNHIEMERARKIKWRKSNMERFKKSNSEYVKKKRYADSEFKIKTQLCQRVRRVLKRKREDRLGIYTEFLGCSLSDFKSHIESLFKDGMTWENHGRRGWNIDHIRPCVLFDLTDKSQQKECFHYTNLQPLWYADNVSKGSILNGVRHRRTKSSPCV